ncbi:MAG: hypothetical protein KJO30_04805 [Boseongicola sp.]|nr:hypothetical protein [Boseongicola sp.]
MRSQSGLVVKTGGAVVAALGDWGATWSLGAACDRTDGLVVQAVAVSRRSI